MDIWEKVKNIVWIFFLGIATFTILASVWIRNTYGTLSVAMTNVYFRNWLQNKRSLFAKHVVLPTLIVCIFLLIVHVAWKKQSRRGITRVSLALMVLFIFLGGGVKLEVGSYLARIHRLAQEQWYDKDNRIMHALGAIEGKKYTNSKEALENSYKNGNYMLECDMILTLDGEVVACHDWEFWNRKTRGEDVENTDYVPTLAEFMESRFEGKYTPLSGDDIVLFMKEHPEVYIITDTKYAEPEKIEPEFRALVDTAVRNGCEEVLDRFVIQIYHGYMYGIVNEIYPFPNYIYTLYQEGFDGKLEKLEEYAAFCMEHNIDVITMWANLCREESLDIAERYGLHIFVHTVNEEKEIESFLEQNVGVYTDNL